MFPDDVRRLWRRVRQRNPRAALRADIARMSDEELAALSDPALEALTDEELKKLVSIAENADKTALRGIVWVVSRP
jgi:hypothetical protein